MLSASPSPIPQGPSRLAEEALADAKADGDDRCVMWAYDELINLQFREGRLHEAIPTLEAACAHAIANGRGAHDSAALADAYLWWATSARPLTHSATPSRGADDPSPRSRPASSPLVVAVRRGDLGAARQHRARTLEVMPNLEHRVGGLGRVALAGSWIWPGVTLLRRSGWWPARSRTSRTTTRLIWTSCTCGVCAPPRTSRATQRSPRQVWARGRERRLREPRRDPRWRRRGSLRGLVRRRPTPARAWAPSSRLSGSDLLPHARGP